MTFYRSLFTTTSKHFHSQNFLSYQNEKAFVCSSIYPIYFYIFRVLVALPAKNKILAITESFSYVTVSYERNINSYSAISKAVISVL